MKRLTRAPLALGLATVCATLAGACSSDPDPPLEDVASPCVAFGRANDPQLRVERVASGPASSPLKVVTGGDRTYVLARTGALHVVEPGGGSDAKAMVLPPAIRDVAIRKNAAGRVDAFALRPGQSGPDLHLELVRYASPDGGRTFDLATEKIMLRSESNGPTSEPSGQLAFGPDGFLYVASGGAEAPDPWLDPQRLLGKILRLDVSGEDAVAPPGNAFSPPEGRPEIWATGARVARNFDVDPELGDVWFTDFVSGGAPGPFAVVQRIGRSVRHVVDPFFPTTVLSAPGKEIQPSGAHVYRGRRAPVLRGKYVALPITEARDQPVTVLQAFDRYGPSGPPQSSSYRLDRPVADAILGRDVDGELLVVTADAVGRIVDDAAASAGPPSSLLATKCYDPASPAGAVAGAVRYDVRAALWSDGAAKERFVVVPKGQAIRAKPDGDLVFPVGTVAVKTFAVDGRRVETRLFVQHAIESWTGYSYAWNADGTDAELVAGNRLAPLPGGKSWYFPSSADCDSCHTPAAGYTLGLEAKQLVGGDAFDALSRKLAVPIDAASVAALVAVDAPPPATTEARARSYLHSNCSTCHREGSATGSVALLDLRSDTPLAATGLCTEPKVDAMGIAGARIVAPRDPSKSVLVARMRTLDDRRMPKLGSSLVDEAGVAAVEAWIRDLASCP